MSLPIFSTQAELFSTAGLSASLFAPTDRYRLLAKLVYPKLVSARGTLERCYCADNGRVALEPVRMLGVSILQELDGVPDRHAVEMLRYHAGWNFALNRQIGDEVFHSTSLVNFRNRLRKFRGVKFRGVNSSQLTIDDLGPVCILVGRWPDHCELSAPAGGTILRPMGMSVNRFTATNGIAAT